jgi:alpha-ribazole phosphatase
MEIFLIRHTTPDVEKGICYGQADIAVKDTFLQEAETVARHIPEGADVIYTSPLARCAQLARHLAAIHNLPVMADDRLKELNFGLWELQAWNAIDPQALQPWMDNYVNVACPGGESYKDLAGRAQEFIETLKNTSQQKILIVTHHGVIKALSAALLNISLEDAMTLTFGYGSVTPFRLQH